MKIDLGLGLTSPPTLVRSAGAASPPPGFAFVTDRGVPVTCGGVPVIAASGA